MERGRSGHAVDVGGAIVTGDNAGASSEGGPRVNARERARALLHDLARVDAAVYAAVASTPTPALDLPMRRLSNSANRSALWLGLAGGLALLGGRRGRRAAVAGVISIGVSSALVNIGMKSIRERVRPDRIAAGVIEARHVDMPASSSFPSGHSASAFAFATAVGREIPLLALPLRALAAAVAYSRVHTGVHYPGDTLAGSLVGASAGLAVARSLEGLRRHREAG
jgi:membrane-associated phospholipid phosphatase